MTAGSGVTARLVLIRHGRAAAGWTQDPDPDLDEVGRAQAEAVAAEMAAADPVRLVTSPLRRARSTAAALERVWGREAEVDVRVGEIPSPAGPEGELRRRGEWLAGVMAGDWEGPALGPELRRWRAALIDALVEAREPTVFTTHFVAINVAVGAATGDSRVTCFRPDYCSLTVLEVAGGVLRLVERGREAATAVR